MILSTLFFVFVFVFCFFETMSLPDLEFLEFTDSARLAAGKAPESQGTPVSAFQCYHYRSASLCLESYYDSGVELSCPHSCSQASYQLSSFCHISFLDTMLLSAISLVRLILFHILLPGTEFVFLDFTIERNGHSLLYSY